MVAQMLNIFINCSLLLYFTASAGKLRNVCDSPHCQNMADDVHSMMNSSVDPCQDFYDFACGGLLNREIPKDRASLGHSESLDDTLQANLLKSMKNKDSTAPAAAKRIVKTYYESCKDYELQTHSNTVLLEDFTKLGGFPILDKEWNETNFDLVDTIVKISKIGYGFNSLLSIGAYEEESGYVIEIRPAKLALDELAYLDHEKHGNHSEVIKAYSKLMKTVLTKLGAKGDNLDKDVQDILEVELSLAKSISSTGSRSSGLGELKNIQSVLKSVDFTRLFKSLFGENNVKEEDSVLLFDISYLYKLNSMLRRKPKRIVANYMFWRVTFDAMGNVDKSFLPLFLDLNRESSGVNKVPPFDELCLMKATGRLNAALSAVYIADHFSEVNKRLVDTLTNNIEKEFVTAVRNSTGLDASTIKNALKKLENIVYVIGHHDNSKNESKVNDYLKKIRLTSSFYENIKTLKALELQDTFDLLGTVPDRNKWTSFNAAHSTNAFFHITKLIVEIPAGNFANYSLHPDNPEFVNYATLGFTIGHELTHALDETGSQFDHNGVQKNWWSSKSRQIFQEKLKCMEEQYNNYSSPDITISGKRTLGENVADNGGARMAYKAYVSSNMFKLDKVLPGFKYDLKQMFWIALAQAHCAKYTPEALKTRLFDDHTIPRYRVIGIVQNQQEFADDFGCKISPMNPEKKCVVW